MDLSTDSNRRAIQAAFPVAVLSGPEPVVSVLLRTGLENDLHPLRWMDSARMGDCEEQLCCGENSADERKEIGDKYEKDRSGSLSSGTRGYDIRLQLLLEYNPNLEARNENDKTPLFRAVDCDHYETITLLRREGANVNAIAKNGWTGLFRSKGEQVLHPAIQSSIMTATLLHYGADMEAKDAYGQTALYPTIQKDKRTPWRPSR